MQDRRVRDELIDALAASRKAGLAGILEGLSRDRLKEICRALDLDDSGRSAPLAPADIAAETALWTEALRARGLRVGRYDIREFVY